MTYAIAEVEKLTPKPAVKDGVNNDRLENGADIAK